MLLLYFIHPRLRGNDEIEWDIKKAAQCIALSGS